MNIAIIDDDNEFCCYLKEYLLCNFNLKASIYNNPSIFLSNNNQYDLIFLDIEMPNISGFEVINKLIYRNINIILITSHTELMRYSFNKNVIGFIEKDNLIDIQRIINNLNSRAVLDIKINNYDHDIHLDEIRYIEYCLRDITIVLFNDNHIKLIEKSLSDIEEKLDFRFFKINRNIIINLDFPIKYENHYVIFNKKNFLVSRRKRTALKIAIMERKIENGKLN